MSFDLLAFAQAHDGTLAELLFDLGRGGLQRLGGFFGVQGFHGCVHAVRLLGLGRIMTG